MFQWTEQNSLLILADVKLTKSFKCKLVAFCSQSNYNPLLEQFNIYVTG